MYFISVNVMYQNYDYILQLQCNITVGLYFRVTMILFPSVVATSHNCCFISRNWLKKLFLRIALFIFTLQASTL